MPVHSSSRSHNRQSMGFELDSRQCKQHFSAACTGGSPSAGWRPACATAPRTHLAVRQRGGVDAPHDALEDGPMAGRLIVPYAALRKIAPANGACANGEQPGHLIGACCLWRGLACGEFTQVSTMSPHQHHVCVDHLVQQDLLQLPGWAQLHAQRKRGWRDGRATLTRLVACALRKLKGCPPQLRLVLAGQPLTHLEERLRELDAAATAWRKLARAACKEIAFKG